MKTFILGNLTDKKNSREFLHSEYLVSQSGNTPVNPLILLESYMYDDELFIEECMHLIKKCNSIYLVDGWQDCLICNRLYGFALGLNLKIIKEKDGI